MIQAITRALAQAGRYHNLVRHVHAHGAAALFEGWRTVVADEQWRAVVIAAAYLEHPDRCATVVRCFRITDYHGGLLPEWAAWFQRAGAPTPAGNPGSQGWRLDVALGAVLGPAQG